MIRSGIVLICSILVCAELSAQSLSLSFTIFPASCAGECNNGYMEANVSGGVPPYSYNWTELSGIIEEDNGNYIVGAGYISCTVTDAANNSITDSDYIGDNMSLLGCAYMVEFINQRPCPGECNGIISLEDNGWLSIDVSYSPFGSSSYQVIFPDYSSGNYSYFENLCPGDYQIYYLNYGGFCSHMSFKLLYEINSPSSPTIVSGIVGSNTGQASGSAVIDLSAYSNGSLSGELLDSTGALIAALVEGVNQVNNLPSGTYTVLRSLVGYCAPDTATFNVPSLDPSILVNARAFLMGPFDMNTQLMADHLRLAGLIPLTEPYTSLGYVSNGQLSAASIDANVLQASGNDAIVDWIIVELRASTNHAQIVASRFGLVQRDGDIVDVDGTSPVAFQAPSDDYFIAIRHRNHLSILSALWYSIGTTPTSVDFTYPQTPTFGTDSRNVSNGLAMMWSGNVNGDGQVKFIGADNDRDLILQDIGGNIPTATITGYLGSDTNMDGGIKYTGSNNDRDPILVNIGGNVPTAVRVEQLP